LWGVGNAFSFEIALLYLIPDPLTFSGPLNPHGLFPIHFLLLILNVSSCSRDRSREMNSRISRVRNGDSELSALLIKLKELTFGRYNGILQTHNFHHQRFKIGTTDLFWLE
jgi:hypothetical protein